MNAGEWVILALCALSFLTLAGGFLGCYLRGKRTEESSLKSADERMQRIVGQSVQEAVNETKQDGARRDALLRQELGASVNGAVGALGNQIGQTVQSSALQTEARLKSLEQNNGEKLEQIRSSMERQLSGMNQQNQQQLDKMRQTVDEKLQSTLETRLNESFKQVQSQLESVYKGLGEMQQVAVSVGDLKKVLSNVKTRGILGEVQLGAILREILSPEQYVENIATRPDSRERVEFAVKLPGGDLPVYLPIDSKFPGDLYAHLQDARQSGQTELIDAAMAQLKAQLRKEAKDIRTKYVEPPYTTEFAVLFLPFEGLYADAVNNGMVEQLQRDYRITLAGPSTMAAYLNSLQMGFQTLAIQKRSSEVWKVLGDVKKEFASFADVLQHSQRSLQMASSDLDKLIGTRTNQILRKLRDVQTLDEIERAPALPGESAQPDSDANED